MLAIFAIICLYGMLASLVNCIFSKTLIPVGPSLFKVQNYLSIWTKYS